GTLVSESGEAPLRIAHQHHVSYPFGREAMALKFHHAEEIAGKGKLGDVTAAIAQMFAQPNNAPNHLVGIFSAFALRKNVLVSSDARFRADLLQRACVFINASRGQRRRTVSLLRRPRQLGWRGTRIGGITTFGG